MPRATCTSNPPLRVTGQQCTGSNAVRPDLILEIPEHFERDITRDGMAPVMISANAVNGMKGSLGSIYASSVAMDFATEIAEENRAYATATDIPVVEVIPQNKFNPHMDYKVFMVPALMVMLLTMLCGFMPALNIVARKRRGPSNRSTSRR